MNIKDFDFYKELLRKNSGFYLEAEKASLLNSRLTPIAKKWGYQNVNMLTVALRSLPDKELTNEVIEAMIDPQTSFFRDKSVFDKLQNEIIPELAEKRRKTNRILNIWCCGCSTGQEAYSIKIIMQEPPLADQLYSLTRNIYATDLSNSAIEKAESGTYSQMEIQNGMPTKLMMKYFDQNEKTWAIHRHMQRFMFFERSNLNEREQLGRKNDITLCRNLISQMDHDIQPDILAYLAEQMAPDGYIIFGKNENILGLSDYFAETEENSGIYVLQGN